MVTAIPPTPIHPLAPTLHVWRGSLGWLPDLLACWRARLLCKALDPGEADIEYGWSPDGAKIAFVSQPVRPGIADAIVVVASIAAMLVLVHCGPVALVWGLVSWARHGGSRGAKTCAVSGAGALVLGAAVFWAPFVLSEWMFQ